MGTFRAMTTDVTVLADAGDDEGVTAAVAAEFAAAEARFSRFRADSELARLHDARGPVAVSPELFAALAAARQHVAATDGVFEPAIGGALAALGYDRSFSPGALDRDGARPHRDDAAAFASVQLDAARREVTLPPGLRVDLGGMIKGRTVDRAAAHLRGAGAIDAGGDLVVRGGDPEGWLVEVEDPRAPAVTIAWLRVRAACATSAANRRRWRVGGEVRHHLIDPRTRRPAVTDLLQVTVVAPSAELAEVLAKAVFILGRRAGASLLARHADAGALLVPVAGPPEAVGAITLVAVARA